MSSTMEQLQQLTNGQLCVLCYNYYITPRQVANLNRRQLERRLHVAIIGERAKQRARRLLDSIQDQSMQDNWTGNENGRSSEDRSTFDQYRRLSLSKWRAMAAREQSMLMRHGQRFSGGDEAERLERLMQLEQDEDKLEYEQEERRRQEMERLQKELEFERQNIQLEKERQQREQEKLTQEKLIQQRELEKLKQQEADFALSQHNKPETVWYPYQQQQQQQEEQQLQYPQQQQQWQYPQEQLHQQDQQLLYTQQQEQYTQQQDYNNMGNNYYKDCDSGEDRTTDYHSFESCASFDAEFEAIPPNAEYQLKRAERFSSQDTLAFTFTDSKEDDSTDREICTVNYITQEQLASIEHTDTGGQMLELSRLMQQMLLKHSDIIGDTLLVDRRRGERVRQQERVRPNFWRRIFGLFYATSRSKVDSNKLQFTIICCTMVVCAYVGVKMLQ